MNLFKNSQTKRKMIMDHYSNPNNKVFEVKNGIDIYSDVCVDELHLEVKIKDNIIVDAKFTGQGCAVFLASTDIMLDVIKDKSLDQLKKILESYFNMISQKGEYNPEILKELLVFENVATHLNRLHCAELIYKALLKI